jgi:hypothetical protein
VAPSFKPLKVQDDILSRVLESVGRCFDFLLGRYDVDARFLEDTGNGLKQGISLLSASTTLVPHGLGHSFTGWKVVDLTADARVWRDTTSTASAALFLPLKCSTNCTVKLEVW